MLWTKTNSLKGLNHGVMNIHQRLSLIGPLYPRMMAIGDRRIPKEADHQGEETKAHISLTTSGIRD